MDPIWAPHVISHINESDLKLYLEFSISACIPGGGCNVDDAIQALYKSGGDIKMAMRQLLAYNRNCQATWTVEEVNTFERLVMLHGKNFHLISRDILTKTVKDCVLFYYLWKKSSLRRTNHNLRPLGNTSNHFNQQQQPQYITNLQSTPLAPIGTLLSSSLTSSNDDSRRESSSTSSSTISTITSTPPSSSFRSAATTPNNEEQQFPCRVCGRIFAKIKSRSAHMKRHKNER